MEMHLSSILTHHEDKIRSTFGSKITNHLSGRANLPQDKLIGEESRMTVSMNDPSNYTPEESMEFNGNYGEGG